MSTREIRTARSGIFFWRGVGVRSSRFTGYIDDGEGIVTTG